MCKYLKRRTRRHFICSRFRNDTQGRSPEIFMVLVGIVRKLYLCRDDRLLEWFHIGYGRRGMGKQSKGDKRTPMGTYRITWMASVIEPDRPENVEKKLKRFRIIKGKAYCYREKTTGQCGFKRTRGRKTTALWKSLFGGRLASVMALDYPNAEDRRQGRTGSCILIHGTYHLGRTEGCIILWPEHLKPLYQCVNPGTRVEIRYKPFRDKPRARPRARLSISTLRLYGFSGFSGSTYSVVSCYIRKQASNGCG